MIPSGQDRIQEQRFRLNPQGLARKDKRLLSAVLPPQGHSLISCDLAAGEPTCTTHYSGDKNYADATFNMVGKLPYLQKDGLLKIDNLYYTVMSVSPMGASLVKELFHAKYAGGTFAERWQENKAYEGKDSFQDFIKAQVAGPYAFHKIGTLGMGYSMGPKKFQTAAYDAGYVITFQQAKQFFNAYWALFADIKKFANVCAYNMKQKGSLVNEFGYRLLPDKEYKAFNYWIQSTVSGIMHVLCSIFFRLAPYCTFLLVIHDEVIFSCPDSRLADAQRDMREAERLLNQTLGWTVNMRIGFKAGKTLYEAH